MFVELCSGVDLQATFGFSAHQRVGVLDTRQQGDEGQFYPNRT